MPRIHHPLIAHNASLKIVITDAGFQVPSFGSSDAAVLAATTATQPVDLL
jgi:hypothetical protein